MRTIKIAFADFWKGFEANWDFITPRLKKHFNIIIDRNNPDILFCSTLHGMSQTNQYKCPKILFIFEDHLSDYDVQFTFSFAPHSDKNFYLPEWQLHCLHKPELIERLLNRPKLDFTNAKFCSFVCSNPAGEMRNKLFHALNDYKRVESYGKHLNNNYALNGIENGVEGYSKEDYFLANPHKFALVCEHTSNGFCSEKLMNGFLSGSVPIYYGDEYACQNFNYDAYIDFELVNTIDIIEYVRWIDENEEYFNEKVNAPVFTTSQKDLFINNLNNFETVLVNQINNLL